MSQDQEERKQQQWERSVLEDLATDALKERRRTRRWGIFFKLLTFTYLGVLLYLLLPDKLDLDAMEPKEKHTALVELDGVIAAKDGVSADSVVTGLRAAFKDEATKAVVLRINSPGGSPVQSSYIQKEIQRLRAEYTDTPLYAVVSDICASGGYYVASAADAIYVNESSIVGSIGVLMNGFGFTDAMDKLGVERRLLTAGEHKGILDPFSPLSEFQKTHAQSMLDELHTTFISVVREGRGDKLKGGDELFSGLFWSGNRAVELGLADGIGSTGYVAREVIGAEDIVDFTPAEDPLQKLADRLGIAAANAFARITGMTSEPRF